MSTHQEIEVDGLKIDSVTESIASAEHAIALAWSKEDVSLADMQRLTKALATRTKNIKEDVKDIVSFIVSTDDDWYKYSQSIWKAFFSAFPSPVALEIVDSGISTDVMKEMLSISQCEDSKYTYTGEGRRNFQRMIKTILASSVQMLKITMDTNDEERGVALSFFDMVADHPQELKHLVVSLDTATVSYLEPLCDLVNATETLESLVIALIDTHIDQIERFSQIYQDISSDEFLAAVKHNKSLRDLQLLSDLKHDEVAQVENVKEKNIVKIHHILEKRKGSDNDGNAKKSKPKKKVDSDSDASTESERAEVESDEIDPIEESEKAPVEATPKAESDVKDPVEESEKAPAEATPKSKKRKANSQKPSASKSSTSKNRCIEECAPDEKLSVEWPEGWIRRKFERQSGATKTRIDKYWYAPGHDHHKLRSLNEVERYLAALRKKPGDYDYAWSKK